MVFRISNACPFQAHASAFPAEHLTERMCPQKPIPQKERILLSWSSGKDSAWCLHILRQNRQYEIVGLLTTFNESANRVAMHGVRRELVERQAFASGLPLWPVYLPWPCA